jgi:hypothetical protein
VPTLPLWPKAFQTQWTNQLERAEQKRKQTKALNPPSPKQPVDKREEERREGKTQNATKKHSPETKSKSKS